MIDSDRGYPLSHLQILQPTFSWGTCFLPGVILSPVETFLDSVPSLGCASGCSTVTASLSCPYLVALLSYHLA